MRITQVAFENIKQKTFGQNRMSSVQTPLMPSFKQQTGLSNVYYLPQFQPNFEGISKLETNVIKKVVGHEYIGLGIFTKGGNYVDCKKIGTELLSKENFNIAKATDEEITAYRYSLAFAEMYATGKHGGGTTWVQRYNPKNRHSPLAVSHSLSSKKSRKFFGENLKLLKNKSLSASLDIPIIDNNGNLLNRVVFDTETTGTKADASIVQLAIRVFKDGKPFKEYNQLVNPKIPIPKEATAIHGITTAMVRDKPTILEKASEILHEYMVKKNGIISAYNAIFDVLKFNKAIRKWRYANPEKLKNDSENRIMKQKDLYKVLDPYIIVQRIHPFLGAKKKLGNQYHWLFCKNMENAHDAMADVKGTDDILKYCLYYLDKHRVDKSKHLTLREVLLFQNGDLDILEKIDIPLSKVKRFNSRVKFNPSYRNLSLNVDNYFDSYLLKKETVEQLGDLIGDINVEKLHKNNVVEQKVDLTQSGYKQAPNETKLIPGTGKYENAHYKMEDNMRKVIGFAELEPYGGKTKEEIEEIVLENSENYLHEKNIQKWIKNVNPEDIKDGNDLPDDEITRRVMREAQEE
ncbi:MAG: 3'-5' exonuclease [Candidatus Gastranaerophilaceae bacterium]